MKKDRCQLSTLVISTLILTIVFFVPARLYPANVYEFSLSLVSVWKFLLPWAFIVAAFLVGISLFLPRRVFEFFIATSSLLCVLFYLQANVFLWGYPSFDGGDVAWQDFDFYGWIEVAIGVAALGLLVWKSSLIFKHAKFVTSLVLLFQLILLARDSLTSPHMWTDMSPQTIPQRVFSLSDTKPNLVIFLLDGFEADAFEVLLAEDPEVRQNLKGFQYFTNHIANFSRTSLSLPSTLSGQPYRGKKAFVDYLEEDFKNKNLAAFLEQQGYVVDLITMPVFLHPNAGLRAYDLAIPSSGNLKREFYRRLSVVMDVALFRLSPHFAKKHIFQNHKWFLQQHFQKNSVGVARLEQTLNLSKVLQDNIEANSEVPTFKFYHLLVPHEPFVLDERCTPQTTEVGKIEAHLDQSRCALRLLWPILERMKEEAVYDNSVIAVVSDHGSRTWEELGGKSKKSPFGNIAFPLLLVKPIGAKAELKTMDAPTSLMDLPQILTKALETETRYPFSDEKSELRSFFRLRAPNQKIRESWRLFNPAYIPIVEEYHIEKEARKESSWKLFSTHEP